MFLKIVEFIAFMFSLDFFEKYSKLRTRFLLALYTLKEVNKKFPKTIEYFLFDCYQCNYTFMMKEVTFSFITKYLEDTCIEFSMKIILFS